MRLNIKLLNMGPLLKQAGDLRANAIRGIATAIRKSAFIIQRSAQTALTVGPTRAILTGRLRADTIVRSIQPMMATIYPIVDYAIYVHEGTRRMRARPFMRAAVLSARDEVEETFKKELQTAIKLTTSF